MTLQHPFKDLTSFPAAPRSAGRSAAVRVVGGEFRNAPLWCGNSGNGRFDLSQHADAGTCYLADSLLGALLETVWRDAVPTGSLDELPPLAPSELADLWCIEVSLELTSARCADVGGTDADDQIGVAFGVTDAVGTCEEYTLPQQWAAAWAAHGFDGVRYRLSHGSALFGWALFGPAGPAERLPIAEVTSKLLVNEHMLVNAGIARAAGPGPDELEIIDETDARRRL